jgi:cytoskeletal protein CcmA (bactofilin family)
MALFGKEPEKPLRTPETLKAQTDKPTVSTAPSSHETTIARAAPVAVAPAAQAASEGRAYLDKGAKVNGKLSFDGPARIDGQVDGEISAKDSIIIGESAVVTAQIKATAVTVAGKVSGDITAAQRIEIRPSAKVLGNLAAPVLVIHEGAWFEGHCAMQAEGARDSKVTAFPKEERLAQAGGQKQS